LREGQTLVVVTFRAVYVAVFFLFVGGFTHFGDFHGEVQGFACQRVVAINGHFITFHSGDGEDARTGFGLGLERTVAWITGVKSVREAIAFPRVLGRINP